MTAIAQPRDFSQRSKRTTTGSSRYAKSMANTTIRIVLRTAKASAATAIHRAIAARTRLVLRKVSSINLPGPERPKVLGSNQM